jgi:hypothetical protein
MDIDWTSEDVIKRALEFIKSLDIPCVLFQTHHSKVIDDEKSKLFTKELHPNFCDNSDHGDSIKEIIDHINQLEHRGIAIRAHKYYMPFEAMKHYANSGYKFAMNNYTNIKCKKTYKLLGDLYELNTFFEDGDYLKNQYPFQTNFLLEKIRSSEIYVFNVHPIHLAFNPNEYRLTRNFKDRMTKKEYRSINDDFIERHKYRGYGISSFLIDLIKYMKKTGIEFISINEVVL